MLVYFRDGSAPTILHAATLRWKLQIKNERRELCLLVHCSASCVLRYGIYNSMPCILNCFARLMHGSFWTSHMLTTLHVQCAMCHHSYYK